MNPYCNCCGKRLFECSCAAQPCEKGEQCFYWQLVADRHELDWVYEKEWAAIRKAEAENPNGLYDGLDVINPDDIISAYVVLNGSLGMKPGKLAAMSFHLGWRLEKRYHEALVFHDAPSEEFCLAFKQWDRQGRRVVVRTAKTEHLFHKSYQEMEYAIMLQDEGLTEVEPGSYVGYVTQPMRRADVPKILSNKKIQLL